MGKVSDKHDVVYHYTTAAGLEGILKSQTLHATHYKYTNDASEMRSIASKLCQLATPGFRAAYEELAQDKRKRDHIEGHGGIDKLVAHDADAFVKALYKVTLGEAGRHKFFDPYVVSFCAHTAEYERRNGLLSQWRGYGQDSGYALVFDTKQLEELMLRETTLHAYDTAHFGDVVYDGDDKAFEEEFPGLIGEIKKRTGLIFQGDPALGALYSEFVSALSRYKHHGFREEQEVRLVLNPRDPLLTEKLKAIDPAYSAAHGAKGQKTVLFKGGMTPYLDVFAEVAENLPIKTILVGPHADKNGRTDRLQRYLEKTNRKIAVECSETPYI